MCEAFTDKPTCENCPDNCRDLERDLEICQQAAPGPVKWQKFGGKYLLIGQYGIRPIILSVVNKDYGNGYGCISLSNRDHDKDLLIPLNPNHPDSKFIEEAWEGWPVAIRRAIVAEDMIRHYQADNKVLKDALICILDKSRDSEVIEIAEKALNKTEGDYK